MAADVTASATPRLERSCHRPAGDWVSSAPARPGLERIEAFFAGHAFDPHRHDTYVVGITLFGVQSFRFRGAAERSLPGQAFVLHPDETHDGQAGTVEGFRYRSLYVAPRLIQAALGGRHQPLPFVRAPVSADARLVAAILPALDELAGPLEELFGDEVVLHVAEALAAVACPAARRPLGAHHVRAVGVARELLDARAPGSVTSAELEAATGLSRYALARHFRACLGTSPYRYLVMRRLDRARALIRTGTPLAEAALAAGFADQSHMTRHFKKSYGLSPGRWAALAA